MLPLGAGVAKYDPLRYRPSPSSAQHRTSKNSIRQVDHKAGRESHHQARESRESRLRRAAAHRCSLSFNKGPGREEKKRRKQRCTYVGGSAVVWWARGCSRSSRSARRSLEYASAAAPCPTTWTSKFLDKRLSTQTRETQDLFVPKSIAASALSLSMPISYYIILSKSCD